MPILSYDEAQAVGAEMHDHWLRMTGEAPIRRDDLGWADLVQFVTRKACERVIAREGAGDPAFCGEARSPRYGPGTAGAAGRGGAFGG